MTKNFKSSIFKFHFLSTFILSAVIMLTLTGSESSKKIFPYQYTAETLNNGLKIIMINMESNGLVAYYSIVRTGSRDEWEPSHSGFAHFFEHMMFRGTKKYPGNVYDSLITSMGANANAYTTDDYTCYHLNIAAEDLEMVMELESDRFQNLHYSEQEFQTESQAVYGEYRKGKTSPWMWIWEKLKETAFDKHTYKHTTIGFEQDIKAMPSMYEYSKSFYNRYYRPENVVLLIVGDIQKDKVMDMVEKYYGSWKPGYKEPHIEAEPSQKKERLAEVKYPGKSLPILSIAFKGAAFNPSDKNVLSAILLGDLAFGENSEIYKKLYLQEQKVQAFKPEFNYNRDPFLWIIWAEIKEEKDLNYIKNEILSTAEKYKSQLPDKTQLENLKKRTKYSFLMSLETSNNVAGNLARPIALTGDIDSIDKVFSTIESITAEDIIAAAKYYLKPENRTIVTLKGTL